MALTRKSSAGASSTSSGVIPDFPNFAPAFVDAPGGVETNEAIQSWWSTAKYQLLALQNGNQQSVDRLTAASDTNVGTLQAEIDNEKIVRANADSALASSISSVSASLTTSIGVVAASVVTEATARATADGYLAGKYTLTVTAGDVVTGMNITSASGPGTNISAVTFVANDFLIYNNVSGLQMFAVSGSLIKLGSVLAVDNANAKLYIGTGNYAASDTAFYVDSAGKFSLKDKLTWDGTNLSVTGSITVTAISGLNYAGSPGPAGSANTLVGQGALATQNTAAYATQVTGTPISASTGALSLATSPSGSGLFLGSDHLGYYASGAWKTYMDNSGNFYLGGTSGALQWNGSTLTVTGVINVTSISGLNYAGAPSPGGAANTIVSQGALATLNAAAYATQVTGGPITASTGALTLGTSPSGSGLFLGSDHLGYYASGAWKTYMDSSGNFYLGGTSGALQWNGSTLTITGVINVVSITGLNYAGAGSPGGAANSITGQGSLATQSSVNYNTEVTNPPTNSAGALIVSPSPSGSGLFLGSTNLGYYASGAWKTYMDNSGQFFLGGSSGPFAWDGSALTIGVSVTSGSYSGSTVRISNTGFTTYYGSLVSPSTQVDVFAESSAAGINLTNFSGNRMFIDTTNGIIFQNPGGGSNYFALSTSYLRIFGSTSGPTGNFNLDSSGNLVLSGDLTAANLKTGGKLYLGAGLSYFYESSGGVIRTDQNLSIAGYTNSNSVEAASSSKAESFEARTPGSSSINIDINNGLQIACGRSPTGGSFQGYLNARASDGQVLNIPFYA